MAHELKIILPALNVDEFQNKTIAIKVGGIGDIDTGELQISRNGIKWKSSTTSKNSKKFIHKKWKDFDKIMKENK